MNWIFLCVAIIFISMSGAFSYQPLARVFYRRHVWFNEKVFKKKNLNVDALSSYHAKVMLIDAGIFLLLFFLPLLNILDREMIDMINKVVMLTVGVSFIGIYIYSLVSRRFYGKT